MLVVKEMKLILQVKLHKSVWWCTLTPTVNDMSSPYSAKHTSGFMCRLMWEQQGHSEARGDGKGHSVCVCHSFRIGVLCAYAANQNLSSQVKNIRRLVNSNMRDLHTFANDTPMVRQSYSTEHVDGEFWVCFMSQKQRHENRLSVQIVFIYLLFANANYILQLSS